MKIRVLLVDDEKLERVLIRKGFPWEEHGFEIIGEADSGAGALEFMKHKDPELVLTDISMPNMSGLELTEQITREYPECYVVIVTGYREFEYARQAVRLGVEDFLLKPLDMAEMKKMAEKIRVKILERRERQAEEEDWRRSRLVEQDILMESFFQRLVEKRISRAEALPKLYVYGCERLQETCCCLNISVREKAESNENHQRVFESIKARNDPDAICFVHYMRNIILFFMDGSKERARAEAAGIFAAAAPLGAALTIGISGYKKGFEGIYSAYEEAREILEASVLLGENRIIEYQDYCRMMEENQIQPVYQWEELDFALINGIKEQVGNLLNEYLLTFRQEPDAEYLKLMVMNILAKSSLTLSRYGTSLFQLVGEDQLIHEIGSVKTIEECRILLEKNTAIILEYHSKKKVKKGNRVVEQALEYVNQNIFNPELTLKKVAETVFSNESYLSRMFKKEVGESLIGYVTKKRIEESIRLLNTTDLKVYEIAEKIGFRDSHYFSICFKKQVGVTVKEFRSR